MAVQYEALRMPQNTAIPMHSAPSTHSRSSTHMLSSVRKALSNLVPASFGKLVNIRCLRNRTLFVWGERARVQTWKAEMARLAGAMRIQT
jgi:hypothetical protein